MAIRECWKPLSYRKMSCSMMYLLYLEFKMQSYTLESFDTIRKHLLFVSAAFLHCFWNIICCVIFLSWFKKGPTQISKPLVTSNCFSVLLVLSQECFSLKATSVHAGIQIHTQTSTFKFLDQYFHIYVVTTFHI